MSQNGKTAAKPTSDTVKPKRRSTGQIRRVGPGRYQMRLFIGFDARGKRHYKIETRHCTAKQAERILRDWALARDNGDLLNPSKGSLANWMDRWLTEWATRVRPITMAQYQMLARTYVLPGLGDIPIPQLTPSLIQEWVSRLTAHGLSGTTVRTAYWVLKRALTTLVERRELADNPCHGITIPSKQRRDAVAFSPEQVLALVDAAHATKWEALWDLLLATGMRPAEALALRWRDIQPEQVRIREAVTKTAEGFQFNPPKTKAGRRTVPLSEHARDALNRYRAGKATEPDALVFATSTNEPLEWRVLVRRYWGPLLKKAGVPPIKPYALRHTNTSLLLDGHCSLPEIKRRLGHSSAEFLIDTYGHSLGSIDPNLRRKLHCIVGVDASS